VTSMLVLGALAVVLIGAYAFGYTPKMLWDAGIAKLKALFANWRD
jgi:hypothetical protein